MPWLTISGVRAFYLIAWHSFGRKPLRRHRRSLCFLRHHRNNFDLHCSRVSPEQKDEIRPVPIESTRWVWEQPPLALQRIEFCN
jgi:hypothetical protein